MTAALTVGWPTQDFPLRQLTTAGGQPLTGLRVRYRVLGDVEAAAENGWILVFHALTGSADVDAWWGPLVGPGKALDTTRHAILAANLLGSCYGSSGPAEWKAVGREPFPELRPADLARAHIPLLEHLGVRHLALATGGSLGGMVALEWGRIASVPTDRLVVFAAPAAASPQAIGWNAVQRMAIEADPGWAGGSYHAGAGPVAGLAAARALAMITYRSGAEFRARFGRWSSRTEGLFDVEHYLRRQGDKLVARFDAASYVALMRTMDLHDIGDPTLAARETTTRVGRLTGVGIDSDILYPASEVRDWVAAYQAAGARAEYREIASLYGHDAFLIEWEQVERILRGA
ncbi:MAG TPA: homoserine O-acetyltransferase [Gemmatimonadales bacterium]|nr:homoserine O-acetyltransferase [Gemmatimonadales bacterium]